MKKILLLIGVLFIACGFVFLIGFWKGAKYSPSTLTGQAVLDVVNEYRVENNLKPFNLDPELCDNLVQRHIDIKRTGSHEGFEEWIKAERLEQYKIAELFVQNARYPQGALEYWLSSPAHKSSIVSEEFDSACAHAGEETAVLMIGKLNSKNNL